MSASKNNQVKILIVDDTPENLEIMGSTLEQHHYDLYVADSGVTALKLVDNTLFDLILLDIMMPEMDGFEVFREIKTREEYQDIPIIFITARVEIDIIVQAFEMGAVDYIKKPINPLEMVCRVKNHVDLKKAKDELKAINLQHTTELKVAMNQLLEREKMASLGSLVSGIAHEINTPLGIGIGAGSLIAKLNRDSRLMLEEGKMTSKGLADFMENLDESIEIMNSNLQRASELIKSFKQIAVWENSELRTTFNIQEYIQAVLLSLKHEYKNKSCRFEVHCPEGLHLNSYPGAVSQILTNLIMNSLIHGFKESCALSPVIGIDVEEKEDRVILRYSDNGCGIPEENLPRIYDPFFTTNRDHGGSGLGLNIIYNIVTSRLGGSILCRSGIGQGTQFTIEIPKEDVVSLGAV